MNAGAYGGEVKDCIDYALCVNEQGSLIKLTTKELELDYRNSIIQKTLSCIRSCIYFSSW